MQSNNPVFARSDEFNGRASTQYADPSQWQIDLSGNDGGQFAPPTVTGRMTLENVVEKTAITIGLVVLGAAVAWFMIGDLVSDAALGTAWALAMGGMFIGFALAMVNSFKKVISPPLVMAYALVEGVFVGAFSKIVSTWAGEDGAALVFQAVLATFVAAGATLAAYKFFNIQVTPKFRRVVMISVFAFAGIMLVNFVLSIFGVLPNGGLRDMNNPMMAFIVGGIAIVLAVFCLIMDFDFVENGVKAGLPEREAWRAAFGLTVTLVWLYLEILRLLAILRGDN